MSIKLWPTLFYIHECRRDDAKFIGIGGSCDDGGGQDLFAEKKMGQGLFRRKKKKTQRLFRRKISRGKAFYEEKKGGEGLLFSKKRKKTIENSEKQWLF